MVNMKLNHSRKSFGPDMMSKGTSQFTQKKHSYGGEAKSERIFKKFSKR